MKVTQVLEAFKAGKYRHICITGQLGIGKSYLFKQLATHMKAHCLYTKMVYERPRHVVLSNSYDHQQVVVATYHEDQQKMIVNAKAYEQDALTMLTKMTSDWIGIDEVGFLEKDAVIYTKTVLDLLETKHMLCVLRKDKHSPLLDTLRNRQDTYYVDLDKQDFDVSCIVMASGESKRYKRNKLLEKFGDKTLIQHTLDQIPYELCKQVVVVTRYQEVYEICKQYPCLCIIHDQPNQSDTIRIGMQHVANSQGYMFVTCDQPLRQKASFCSLLAAFKQDGNRFVRLGYLRDDVYMVGNPVIFPKVCEQELQHLQALETGSTIIKRHSEPMCIMEARSKQELMDIDTPQDYQELLKYI